MLNNTLTPSILQQRTFLDQKARAGWRIHEFEVAGRTVGVMEKTIPLFGAIWYLPKGPATDSVEDLSQVLDELIALARKHHVVSLKIEPELPHDTDMSPLIERYGLLKTRPVQYNAATVIVDLSQSLDDLMRSFNQKGRHAIRRAERDGVVVKKVETTDENCQAMYDLLRATADGAGFPIRPYEYYCDFYRAYGEDGGLFLAYFDGQPVAGGFGMVSGTKSMYKDGASVRDRPAYGASHLLQWHMIQWAKAKGSLKHDLAGAPPIARAHDHTHPLYAIGKFKRQFNSEITEYIGAYNVPVAPIRGKLWHAYLEKVVRKLYFMRHKQSWY